MSKIFRQGAVYLTAVCLMIGPATTAFAVPPEQILFVPGKITIGGPCCSSFNQTITVSEPKKPVAVVVTFEVGFINVEAGAHAGFQSGLMVNGGPCKFFGSTFIPTLEELNIGLPRTFHWIVFPSDGLRRGTNTFTLCGGGTGGSTQLTVDSITLAARLSD